MLTKTRKAELIARIKRIRQEGERRQVQARARLEACEQYPQSRGHEVTLAPVGGLEGFLRRLDAAGARWPPGPQEWKLIRGRDWKNIPGHRPAPGTDPDIASQLFFTRDITDQAECIEAHALVCELLRLHPKSEAAGMALCLFVLAYFVRVAEPAAFHQPPRPWADVLRHRSGGRKPQTSPTDTTTPFLAT